MPLGAAFTAGTTLGGTMTGVMLTILAGLLSPLPSAWRLGAAVVLAIALAGLDLATSSLPLPQRTTLIPQEVFHRGMRRGLFLFGIEYGVGWRVLIPSAAPWIIAATLVLINPSWWITVAAGTVFGLGRSLAIWQMLLWGEDGWQWRLARHSRLLERIGSVATAALVLLAAWLIVG